MLSLAANVFLGYRTFVKGYRCLHIPTSYVSRHIVFDESIFPYAVSSSQAPATSASALSPQIFHWSSPPVPGPSIFHVPSLPMSLSYTPTTTSPSTLPTSSHNSSSQIVSSPTTNPRCNGIDPRCNGVNPVTIGVDSVITANSPLDASSSAHSPLSHSPPAINLVGPNINPNGG
ncbi:hypothetical protein U1Q18_003232 [Sarracenia purpurea var. burkii]